MITACSDWWHRTIATLCPRSYIPIPMKSSLTVHCGHLPHSAHRAKVRPRVREPRACITIACGDLRAQFPLRHDNSRRTRCHSERSAAYIACRPIKGCTWRAASSPSPNCASSPIRSRKRKGSHHRAQVRHGDPVTATDVDTAQQRDVGRHPESVQRRVGGVGGQKRQRHALAAQDPAPQIGIGRRQHVVG